MPRRFSRLVCLLVALAALASWLAWSPVAAQQVPNRLALVVGNDRYQHVSALNNARNDARLFAQALREARFDVVLVEDVDRVAFWRAIDTFQRRVRKGDEVVFYYAGHGVQIGSDPVLLPVDIATEHEAQVARDGVAIHFVQDALRDAGVALLVIDACRDNPFPRQGTRSIGQTRGLVPVEAAAGMAVILSAGRGQTALDSVPGTKANHGLFTHALVQALRTPGLPVRQALLLAREQVEQAALSVGHLQRPALVDEMRGNFYLFPRSAAAAPAPPVQAPAGRPWRVQTDAEIEQQAWDGAQRANHVAAYEAYLREYPAGRFAPAARVQIAALQVARAAPAASAPAVPPAVSPTPARPLQAEAAVAARNGSVQVPLAAPAARPAPAAGDLAVGSAFVYRVTDGFTKITREVAFRVDAVEGDRISFNGGSRVEDRGGRVVEVTGSIAGDFDLHEPTGGWVSEELLRTGRARLRYRNRVGDEVNLDARVVEETSLELPSGKHQVVHIRYNGHASQHDGRTIIPRPADFSVWYDPALKRPVAFSSRIVAPGSGWAMSSRERAELIRRE